MQKIRELRERQNKSQTELARATGLAQSTISAIETGAIVPSLRTLRKLAAALGVSVASLLDENQITSEPTGTDGPNMPA